MTAGAAVDAAGIARRVQRVRARIADAARAAGRDPSGITLVAVSKTFPPEAVAAAVGAGVADVGENRVQELVAKMPQVPGSPRWHFVGHLQSNKAAAVAGRVHLIHSLDRLALARRVARLAARADSTQAVLVQVNVSGEATKHGVAPEDAAALAEEAQALEGLEVRGLMTMPPPAPDPEQARPYFAALARLRDAIAARVPSATELSMGMSGDFEVAISEGATIVRVGEAIFGPRAPRTPAPRGD